MPEIENGFPEGFKETELGPLPADWEDAAVRSARAVGAEIAGVDLLPGPLGPIVVEVNAVPGWRGLQSALGQDIAAVVVGHLKSRRPPRP